MQTDNGTNTEVGKETFEEIMTKHYPSHTAAKYPHYNKDKVIKLTELMGMYNEWLNKDRVSKALTGFKAKKSPGPDGIKPIIFPFIPNSFLEQIVITYKACIALEYTPVLWKESKVIFIPKPGKDCYNKAKSFRPISLSNYLLKGLEKLCVWKMEEDMKPIHKNQHGFQKGKSTETAISKTVNVIENLMNQDKYLSLIHI